MDARLSIRFEPHAMALVEQQPPWKVVRAFREPSGEMLVHLNNVSGGVLGGDRLDLRLELDPGVHAQVTTTGATRLYRPRADSADAVCSTSIHIGAEALLEWLPDPIIPFAGARFEQRTAVHMARGATLFWWETLAPGRAAAGEWFAYERLRIISEVWVDELPLFVDRIQIRPAVDAPRSITRHGPRHAYVTSFVICKTDEPSERWRRLEADLQDIAQRHSAGDVQWGVSMLAAYGLLIRGLSGSSMPLAAGLNAFWTTAKQTLCGREARPPRKMY